MASPRHAPEAALNVPGDKYPMVADRLYDYEFALRNSEKLLNQDPKIREADRKLVQAFMRHIKAQGVSIGRQAKYVNHLRRSAQLIPVPFSKAKRGDIEELITRLTDFEWFVKRKDGTIARRTRYSAETMADYRMVIKRFMKFVRYGDTDKETPFPDEVRWIRTTVKLSDKQEPEFFNDEEAEAMIRAATSLRDKALLSLWAEVGGRPSEILLLKVGDVQFDDVGAIVHITKGKTGSRTLRIISSARHLAAHMETHPFKGDPDAPMWLTTCSNRLNQPLSWEGMSRMIKITAKRAGIKKRRVHGYMFRHGSATRNAKYLTDSELKRMYGWSMASRMPAVYIHLSAADLDQKYQQVYGAGRHIEPPKPTFAPTICPRCGEKAALGMLYCPKCATPLDRTERAKMAIQEQNTKDEVTELRGLLEKYLKRPAQNGENLIIDPNSDKGQAQTSKTEGRGGTG
jgi:integrase/recombinase XerD